MKLRIYENHICELQGEELYHRSYRRNLCSYEKKSGKKNEKSVSAAGVNTAVII